MGLKKIKRLTKKLNKAVDKRQRKTATEKLQREFGATELKLRAGLLKSAPFKDVKMPDTFEDKDS